MRSCSSTRIGIESCTADSFPIPPDAPLHRTPVLVRAGGILLLGAPCSHTIYDGTTSRTALIFPSPSLTTSTSGSSGTFTLIEDDGGTNAHLEKGEFTELQLSFAIRAGGDEIEVGCKVVHGGYALPYREMAFELPAGDARQVVAAAGQQGRVAQGGGKAVFWLEVPPL